eukprot:Gregarina_sp_Poly_1__2276@NODE_1604_length_3731_cov_125_331059_g1056_i0_p2_GENE_NODE_1604_length_3731_cov_125_331059_g1056_i0NODE_1604_length_3731_cov_125_331059_g1056_i0_p2_ORF_typecomplete_len270_score31_35HIT/PF01230_23/1_2e20DcpS_C/PF11969_8/5_8e07CwfJ_C_1/PF04677_15/0_0041DUF4921/PF16268_5/1_9e03DUF4921/PF16268_5/0_021DUF4921/PF16268_5/2_3e02GalP_UDP_tr_C/PF02744_17/0_012_NODE_1604_length_3731_cov_125_331059_g1056_i014202229
MDQEIDWHESCIKRVLQATKIEEEKYISLSNGNSIFCPFESDQFLERVADDPSIRLVVFNDLNEPCIFILDCTKIPVTNPAIARDASIIGTIPVVFFGRRNFSVNFSFLVMSGYIFGKWPIAQDEVFLENDTCFATVNLKCLRPGHIMVITKEVKPKFADLTAKELTDLSDLSLACYKLLKGYYVLDRGCTVTIQDGINAGQTVRHLHMHIVPNTPSTIPEKHRQIWNLYTVITTAPDPEGGSLIPPRTRQEMKDEAASYRKFLIKTAS